MSQRIDIIVTNNPKEDATMAGIANITDMVDGAFSWTISAQGGFISAQLTLKTDEVTAFQVLNDYVGKRIIFTNPLAPWASMICWEGQIFTVAVDDGKTNVSRSMENVYNSVRVQYAGRNVNSDGSQVIKGDIRTTAAATNASSIATYGTREVLWQVGAHANNSEATTLRDIIAKEYNTPKANLTATRFGGGVQRNDISVTIDCVGFVEQLGKRLPTKTTSNDFRNYKTNITWILTNYSDFISTNYANVGPGAGSEYDRWLGKVTARVIIDALCAKGGFGGSGSGYASYFGVAEDRLAYWKDTPTTVKYLARKYDSGESIVDATTGEVVAPWLVRPCNILRVPDLLPDEATYSATLGDPRNIFIQSVRFIAPNRVVLSPGGAFPGSSRFSAVLGSTALGYNFWGAGR